MLILPDPRLCDEYIDYGQQHKFGKQVGEIHDLKLSILNVILFDDSTSIASMASKRVLLWLGSCCRTSRADMARGAWEKYSTMLYFLVARELGLKVEFMIVLLGGRNIDSKPGFSIWRGPYGGVTKVEGGSSAVPLVTFFLLDLLGGVSYVVV
jgi:hypothetical protein